MRARELQRTAVTRVLRRVYDQVLAPYEIHLPVGLRAARRGVLLLAAMMSFLAVTLQVDAQYNVSYVDLTPPGALGGAVAFTSGSQQAGTVDNFGGIWSGPSHQFLSLHPSGVENSSVASMSGNQQVGGTYRVIDNGYRAAIWSGTVSSYRSLNPPQSISSFALGTTGVRQVGYITTSSFQTHAALWSGTAASFVDLNPSPGVNSYAYAIAGDQQAGSIQTISGPHAAIWSGTAASFRDMNPPGARASEIFATTGTQQAGIAAFGDRGHAGIWFGTPDSFVDINPAGALDSEIRATIGTHQAGAAWFQTKHAVLWFGSAGNYIDLQLVLGQSYRESSANSLWTDGTTILVAGYAFTHPGQQRPILWLISVPEPNAGSLFAAGLLLWLFASARIMGTAQLRDRSHDV